MLHISQYSASNVETNIPQDPPSQVTNTASLNHGPQTNGLE